MFAIVIFATGTDRDRDNLTTFVISFARSAMKVNTLIAKRAFSRILPPSTELLQNIGSNEVKGLSEVKWGQTFFLSSILALVGVSSLSVPVSDLSVPASDSF